MTASRVSRLHPVTLPLLDPPGWELIPDSVRACLKCGPGNGFCEKAVPETFYLGWPLYDPICFTPACQRHDADYRWLANSNRLGKETSDTRFRRNMFRLVYNAGGPRWLRRYRYRMAWRYYVFVRDCGGSSFWSHKVSAIKRDNWERKMDGLS
jgi:hypothetical protein